MGHPQCEALNRAAPCIKCARICTRVVQSPLRDQPSLLIRAFVISFSLSLWNGVLVSIELPEMTGELRCGWCWPEPFSQQFRRGSSWWGNQGAEQREEALRPPHHFKPSSTASDHWKRPARSLQACHFWLRTALVLNVYPETLSFFIFWSWLQTNRKEILPDDDFLNFNDQLHLLLLKKKKEKEKKKKSLLGKLLRYFFWLTFFHFAKIITLSQTDTYLFFGVLMWKSH